MSTQEQDGQAKKELDDFEAKLLAELDSDDGSDVDDDLPPDDSEGEGADGGTDEGQQADAQGEIKPAASGKAAESEGQGDKPGAAAEDQQDDDKAGSRSALRAARRAERLARQRAEQLERELAELRAKNGGTTEQAGAEDDTDDDVLLQDLEQDMPTVAAKFKRLKTQLEEAQARLKDVPKAQAEDEPAFVPESLPKELQAVVDEIDDLSDWQHDPRLQTQWELAKRVDGFLTAHPKWKDKPVAERLTEVVRRVKDELDSASSAPAPTKAPARRKPAVIDDDDDAPETLSGVRGGTSPRNTEPDFSRMTDDQILASL